MEYDQAEAGDSVASCCSACSGMRINDKINPCKTVLAARSIFKKKRRKKRTKL